jgi:hypothetical protein
LWQARRSPGDSPQEGRVLPDHGLDNRHRIDPGDEVKIAIDAFIDIFSRIDSPDKYFFSSPAELVPFFQIAVISSHDRDGGDTFTTLTVCLSFFNHTDFYSDNESFLNFDKLLTESIDLLKVTPS